MEPQIRAEPTPVAISKEEREFFVQLGARIAELRKAQNVTQAQLARTLDISQQTMNAYEMGHRRVPVSALPTLARTLGVSLEALIGEKATPAKRGPAPQIQQKIERLTRLPKAKQKLVLEMLDGVLQQAAR
jgi:transcriptional regulator with XRE-family HTH domain